MRCVETRNRVQALPWLMGCARQPLGDHGMPFIVALCKVCECLRCESTDGMETKEFCGAAWPIKELKRKERNSYCPLIAPKKFFIYRVL